MYKAVPVWVFLLCLMIGALFTVVFGWSVKSTLSGSDLSGSFGKTAVRIASFPTTVKFVFTEAKVDAVDKYEKIRVPRTNVDLSDYITIKAKPGININGLLMRTDRPSLPIEPGWRILVGAFRIDNQVRNAAVALSPDLEIANLWLLTEEDIDGWEPRASHRKIVHGFDIMDDGSVIFAFDGGVSLQRFDQCGSRIWASGGKFNHSVTLTDNQEFVWTLHESSLAKVSTATGETVLLISMDEIITANPQIAILDILQREDNDLGGNSRNTTERWLGESGYTYFHLNDVDPLPTTLADHYDNFEAGDLLVSARAMNSFLL